MTHRAEMTLYCHVTVCRLLLLNPVYTIQPVVIPVEQLAASCKQTFNRWSNRLSNRLFNPVVSCNQFTRYNRLSSKPVEQPAASCKQTFNRWSNRLSNRLFNPVVLCKRLLAFYSWPLRLSACRFRDVAIIGRKLRVFPYHAHRRTEELMEGMFLLSFPPLAFPSIPSLPLLFPLLHIPSPIPLFVFPSLPSLEVESP